MKWLVVGVLGLGTLVCLAAAAVPYLVPGYAPDGIASFLWFLGAGVCAAGMAKVVGVEL